MILANKSISIGRLRISFKVADQWVKTHEHFKEYPMLDLAYVTTKYSKGLSFTTPWTVLLLAWSNH